MVRVCISLVDVVEVIVCPVALVGIGDCRADLIDVCVCLFTLVGEGVCIVAVVGVIF